MHGMWSILQEVLNRIMQRIMSMIITLALVPIPIHNGLYLPWHSLIAAYVHVSLNVSPCAMLSATLAILL